MSNPEFGLPEGGKDDAENPGSVRSLSLAFIPEPADDGVTSDSVRTEPANYWSEHVRGILFSFLMGDENNLEFLPWVFSFNKKQFFCLFL